MYTAAMTKMHDIATPTKTPASTKNPFVYKYETQQTNVKEAIRREFPGTYMQLMKLVMSHSVMDVPGQPDPENIHEIDNGQRSGILFYIIPENGPAPERFWYVKIRYELYSNHDFLQSLWKASHDPDCHDKSAITEDVYMIGRLIIQSLKELK